MSGSSQKTVSANNGIKHYDAIVVGAGVVGATLALSLAQQKNWNVALVEKQTALTGDSQPNLRATALGLSSQDLLSDLGIWQKLTESHQCAYQKMFVWDENSDSELSFNAQEYGEESLGWIVDHAVLQKTLQDDMARIKNESNQSLNCFYAAHIESFQQETSGVSLRLSNESGSFEMSAQWLFAADGVDSQLRAMAGIPTSQHHYQQQGIVAKIQTEQSHQYTAWQRYLDTGSIALLPLSDGECSIVWSAGNSFAEKLLSLSTQDFERHLQNALQSRFGQVELCSKRVAFPLRSVRTERYVQNSLVLVGDAAHGIHPMAGQGANLGFNDIASLLEEIANMAASDSKMPRALRCYERQQKLQNYTMDSFLTGLDAMFRTNSPILHTLRKIGLKVVDEQGFIKSLFAQQVLGKR